MDKFMKFVDTFYKVLQYALNDILIYPKKNLTFVRFYTLGLFGISALSTLLDLPKFLNWQGTLLATAVTWLVYYIEEFKERDQYERMGELQTSDGSRGEADKEQE